MKFSAPYLPLLLAAVALLPGCRDDYDPSLNLSPSLKGHYLRASSYELEIPSAEPYSGRIDVESRNTPWMFGGMPDWLTLTPTSSPVTARVVFDVTQNSDANSPRTALFYLTSQAPDWSYTRALSMTQPKATPLLEVSNTFVGIGGGTTPFIVNVTANCGWSASSDAEWLSLQPDNSKGTLTLLPSPNPSNSYRYANVTVSYGDAQSVSISVTQSPSQITASASTFSFENTASAYELEIESEVDWTTAVSGSWISVSPDNGKVGTTAVSIEVAPNTSVGERTGYVTIITGSTQRLQLTVVQKGIYIEGPASIELGYAENSKTISLKSNTSWTVLSKSDWLSLSKDSGEGDAEITVTSEDNPFSLRRTGEIIFGQEGLSIEYKVTVYQSGKSFSADATLIEFDDKGGTSTFHLTTDAAWTSSVSADWLSVSPQSGRGDAEITVTAQPNNTSEERAGTITYSYADRTVDINLHQLAKYLNIDNNSFSFPSEGGSHSLSISSNGEWNAVVEEGGSWLHVSESSGYGAATITISADDNASVNRRYGCVVINISYTQGVRINVSQQERFLNISTQNVLFFSKGGTSETISVATNGKYSISCDAGWLTINRINDSSFSLFAAPNNSSEQRKATVAVSLTDLKEGSYVVDLPVVQAGEGGSFIIEGYPADSNWDAVGSGGLSVTVKGYTSDKNWDSHGLGSLKVTVTGYSEDGDWNRPSNTGGDITNKPYPKDSDWNKPDNTGADIKINSYSNDKNWNN